MSLKLSNFAIAISLVLAFAGVFVHSQELQNGTSTRYWDCCKPSCAWPETAKFKNGPVKTCAINGSFITDTDAKSGCDSTGGWRGPSFACSNQQPWAVNDTFSYGFAAAVISGGNAASWCCSCYELTFTSGPVIGKKFLVQVTNTGDDLGQNHFDLQMPGGGVGIFNGCTAQYAAPDDGWGERYGGISNRTECSLLPEELQPGCLWRFDWFLGADNPDHQFRKVDCPTVLTDKSGCIRADQTLLNYFTKN